MSIRANETRLLQQEWGELTLIRWRMDRIDREVDQFWKDELCINRPDTEWKVEMSRLRGIVAPQLETLAKIRSRLKAKADENSRSNRVVSRLHKKVANEVAILEKEYSRLKGCVDRVCESLNNRKLLAPEQSLFEQRVLSQAPVEILTDASRLPPLANFSSVLAQETIPDVLETSLRLAQAETMPSSVQQVVRMFPKEEACSSSVGSSLSQASVAFKQQMDRPGLIQVEETLKRIEASLAKGPNVHLFDQDLQQCELDLKKDKCFRITLGINVGCLAVATFCIAVRILFANTGSP
jgi:hypothetical protein